MTKPPGKKNYVGKREGSDRSSQSSRPRKSHEAAGRTSRTDKGRDGRETSWDHVSQWYGGVIERESGSYQTDLILPSLLPLLRPTKGMRLLDLGCGPGLFAAAFARKGAFIIGVDVSPRFIEEAKKKVPADQGRFYVGPAENLPVADAAANAALAVLSLQNIEHFETAVRETARALEPGSPFHIVLNHPAFRIPRGSGWGQDAARKIQYRRIDRSFSSFALPIQMHPGKNPDLVTYSFHRPLEQYVRALADAGFVVADLREWCSHKESVGKNAKAENRARDEIPLFLYLRAEKKSLL